MYPLTQCARVGVAHVPFQDCNFHNSVMLSRVLNILLWIMEILNKLHRKKLVGRLSVAGWPTTYWPPTDHLLTTYHLPATYQPSTNHLPTTYPQPTHHLPTTYPPPTNHLPIPPTNHLPTTYPPPTHHLPITYSPPTHHLPTTYQPPTHHLPIPPTNHLWCSLFNIAINDYENENSFSLDSVPVT